MPHSRPASNQMSRQIPSPTRQKEPYNFTQPKPQVKLVAEPGLSILKSQSTPANHNIQSKDSYVKHVIVAEEESAEDEIEEQ